MIERITNMNVINVPIVEFYKNCIPAAKDSGFMYIVSLIARDADIFELYDNLLKQWNSLDSITGRNFLFIIAGNESSEHVDENSLIYLDHSCGCYKYNPYIKILKERRMSLNIEDNANDLCHQEIEIHQTIAVNKLKEYFHIKESQIPCLVFKDISSQRYKNIIIPVTEDNLYQYFKKLFNDIEPLLSELELINQQLKKRQDGNLSMKRENIISSINKEIRKNKMGSYETQRQHEPQQFNVNYNQTFENNTIYGTKYHKLPNTKGSAAAMNGLFRRLAPFAKAEILPRSLVRSTIRLSYSPTGIAEITTPCTVIRSLIFQIPFFRLLF